jgi:Ca2+-binding RTX toxin-like protein
MSPRTIFGYRGDDRLRGRSRNDRLFGDDSNDVLNGYGRKDYLSRDFGDDQIFALDNEADEILCGPGNDVASYDPAPAGGESPLHFLDGSCENTDDIVD